MKALVYSSVGMAELQEVPEPQVTRPHEVKVRIYGTGICGTDHKMLQGKVTASHPGTILGHEGVGTVTETGPAVTTVTPGDRVVINPTQSCRLCHYCRRGQFCYCVDFYEHQIGFTLPGTFCEYYVGDERYMYQIPQDMSWRTASLIEPLGCSLNGVLRARITPADSVLVIGSGPIGLLCQTISSRCARLTVATEVSDVRRTFAASIVDRALHPDELNRDVLGELNDGLPFDVVIDAVGNQLDVAFSFIARGGRVVPMGYNDRYVGRVKPADFIDFGTSMTGEVVMHDAIGPAIDLARNLPHLEKMVSLETPLDSYQDAFDATMGIDLATGRSREITAIKGMITS
jgi:(R,R)-butanediol dehydrogenase / meso-butanediol dehydrogenase / diacetyl reductase